MNSWPSFEAQLDKSHPNPPHPRLKANTFNCARVACPAPGYATNAPKTARRRLR